MQHALRLLAITLAVLFALPGAGWAATDPHGLSPSADMTFLPHLAGLRNKTYKNQYGQKKSLSEAIVLRGSEIKDGAATVQPGGLFYLSETSHDARPLMRDPFLVLGEHACLVDLKTAMREYRDVALNKGDRAPLGDSGYRLWFDYSTDHYEVPYAEFAVISPSGGFPLEFPIASEFPKREEVRDIHLEEGLNPQLEKFYLDNTYYFGASRYVASKVGFDDAEFSSIAFPEITEATFSLQRPVILEVRQEDYRFYLNKRIYAFRRPDGFLIRVTNFTGGQVLAEKLVKPVTAQEYKTRPDQLDKYHLTIPELDMRVEIVMDPAFLKDSDFVPWSTGKAHGYSSGYFSFVVYRDLVTVKNGQPWPLDKRYNVVLEPNLKTGMLQRLVLENNEPVTFDKDHDAYAGPVKYSDVWNRTAFKVVVKDLDGDVARNIYVRDYYGMRTDNMVMWPNEGKADIDFFLGSSPVLEPIIERSFLTRLADSSYGTVVEESRFSSYPKVISDASFYEPDHTAPFVPRLGGLMRKVSRNRNNERLLSAEAVVIRGSYVDYRNGRIVIPPAGLCYTSRNARNIRTLAGESFFLLGRRAYLTTFSSGTFVRKDFDLDFWKNQPMGDGNLMYWQDELLGERNKALRYTGETYLDDRPVASLSLMKYSGNRWGAHFYLAQGFDKEKEAGDRYFMPDLFSEGATYIQPEYIGSNYVKIREFGTPSLQSISYTYNKPKSLALGAGESAGLGTFTLRCDAVDPQAGTLNLALLDKSGAVVGSKTVGPLDDAARRLLPQHMETARRMQFKVGAVMAELDVKHPFKDGKANLWLYTGIQELERDTPFEFDPRFMVRPDVCGHCYQLNEVLLDNPEPIVLDREHPVFEGPKNAQGEPLFRIVIDSFDGEMVQAWHIETGEKDELQRTDNLAFRPRNNVDVLVGVNGTIEGFLRLSMLPRLGFMDHWRVGSRAPHEKLSGSVNTGGSAHIRR
ncbi:hypothetical protein [Pseudodesulfovibrio sp.]|uniref:hypothetical protein n=1 Tax=Pseudodesulfovibrio sp. TaxID=2035812 RepID=UPI002627A6CA|nr:hypothetical protein [Pseudodesulfovibrio sp.]MDD3311772.1 hypothetical protein [Pseudodesulfovibrio sp.]